MSAPLFVHTMTLPRAAWVRAEGGPLGVLWLRFGLVQGARVGPRLDAPAPSVALPWVEAMDGPGGGPAGPFFVDGGAELWAHGGIVLRRGAPPSQGPPLEREESRRVLGREDAGWSEASPAVGRTHFALEATRFGLLVEDLGSSNGTWVEVGGGRGSGTGLLLRGAGLILRDGDRLGVPLAWDGPAALGPTRVAWYSG